MLSCEDATHFLTPAFSNGHFVVLLYNLQECTVTVFDGLYMDIKHWELGCQLLSNYLVIPVVTVFCSQILVTLLTFDTVTGKISESKWKVTSK